MFWCCSGSSASGEKDSKSTGNGSTNNNNITNRNQQAQHQQQQQSASNDNRTAGNTNVSVPTPDPSAAQQRSYSSPTATGGANNGFALVAFGHPLLDMISLTNEHFLDKYNIPLGSSNLVKEDQMPIFRDMASHPANVQYVPGGSSMNTARIVRWILRCSRPSTPMNEAPTPPSSSSSSSSSCGMFPSARTVMIGAVGDDEFEGILRHALEAESVDHIFFKKQQPTGTCAVLVVEGERSLLANLGAATKLTGADVFGNEAGDAGEAWDKSNNAVIRALDNCRAVYMEGFFMNLAESSTSVHVAQKCTEKGKTFAFNLSAPYLSSIFPECLDKILPHVDILFGSRIDAVAYGKAKHWQCASEESDEDLGEIATMLASDHALPRAPGKPSSHRRVVVITDGANATVVGVSPTVADAAKGGAGAKPRVMQFTPDLVPVEQIVDSNGAGDAFAGGFLAGHLLGYPVDKSVALGHAAASVILKHSGCTFPSVPPFEVSQIRVAAPFSGSLGRRQSVFGRSFVQRRRSEAGVSTATSHDDEHHNRNSHGEDFFEEGDK